MQMRATALLVALLIMMNGCKATDATRSSEAATPVSSVSPQTSSASSSVGGAAGTTGSDSSDDHRRPVIVCFGDSLTAGYGVEAEESYPSRLQTDLDNAGYHYRVVNMGISGETTKDGLARVDRVVAMRPAIVVVEFGGNDGLRGIPISTYHGNLDGIVARLRQAGVQVALAGITLPPQFSGPYIQQFNEVYRSVARANKVPLYPFLLQNVYGVQGSIQQDGIHPTAQGCIQVARNVAAFLQPMLKK